MIDEPTRDGTAAAVPSRVGSSIMSSRSPTVTGRVCSIRTTIPQIPSTTSGLEGFFGSSKRGVRQTTGRKSTAGGRIESCAEVVVRLQALLGSLPSEHLHESLLAVPSETYRQTRQRLYSLRQPARERRSIQRDHERYLDRVLDDWLDTS
jgi:hypothetical protein